MMDTAPVLNIHRDFFETAASHQFIY